MAAAVVIIVVREHEKAIKGISMMNCSNGIGRTTLLVEQRNLKLYGFR